MTQLANVSIHRKYCFFNKTPVQQYCNVLCRREIEKVMKEDKTVSAVDMMLSEVSKL